ncbi:MAG TPA: hypothetical protein VFA18_05555, partial [Gemmataceae bacterium]|nr:hypothetical protein [Gemmataceae bacterium]
MQPAPSSLGVCFRLAWPSVLLAGFLLGPANLASAQQPTVIWTYDKVGTAAELPNITPRSTLTLRPNITQAAYLYVRAGSQGGGPYTASLIWVNPQGGKQEVATASVAALKANETRIITGWKLAGAAAPAPVPPPAPAPAGAAPAPAANVVPGIELVGLAPVFQIQLTPTKAGAAALPPQPFQIGLERPADYLTIEGTHTSPNGSVNRVEITVTAKAGFHGPACPVRLDLSTLPGLNRAAIRGVLTGKVAKPGDKATLVADLGFVARAKGKGAVGVTADDFTQAELFGVDFSEATNKPTLAPVKEPRLEVRLPVPLCNTPSGLMFCSKPVETLPAHLEVYTPASRAGSVAAWFEYQGKAGEKIAREGTREQHIHLLPPKPDGALLFKTVLRDWILNVPTPGTAGQTQLIAQLNTTEDGRGQTPIEIRSDVLFDDTPPTDITLTAVLPTERIEGRRVP